MTSIEPSSIEIIPAPVIDTNIFSDVFAILQSNNIPNAQEIVSDLKVISKTMIDPKNWMEYVKIIMEFIEKIAVAGSVKKELVLSIMNTLINSFNISQENKDFYIKSVDMFIEILISATNGLIALNKKGYFKKMFTFIKNNCCCC